ncbi:MAG: hypothetical protein HY814_03900 [Candidatus Riflebacteria bacterium]|nr:hypothetical protein [Candidatus Riflebacteria bacterium]
MSRLGPVLIALLAVASCAAAEPTEGQIRESYYRSYSYEHALNYSDAIKALLVLRDAYPKGYTVNLRLGWLYYASGSHANALKHYEAAMKALPAAVEPKLGYLLPLLATSRYQEAEAAARQILQVDPANFLGNLRLVQTLRYQEKFEAAAQIASGMLVLYPTDVGFLVELALCKVGLEDAATAKSLFFDVLILDPENVVAKQQLGKL